MGYDPDGGVALSSHDGGRTWERGAVSPLVWMLTSVSFVNADHGWAVGALRVGGAAVVVTTDGGRTWELQTLPGGVVDLNGVAFADEQRGWVVGAYNGANGGNRPPVMLATSDGGSTWISRPVPPGAEDVGVIGDNRIVVVGQGPICSLAGVPTRWCGPESQPMAGVGVAAISDDGGATWQAVTQMPETFFWKVAVHGQQVWALGGLGGNWGSTVYRSDDAGLTWTEMSRAGRQPLSGGAFMSRDDGWTVSFAMPCVFVTEDAGASWRGYPLVPSFTC